MNYAANSHNRKLKHKIHLLLNRLSFNFLNLSGSYKIALLGTLLMFFSLFFSWISIPSDNGIASFHSVFSIYTGYWGWILVIILGFLSIVLLSNTNRERLKSKTYIIFPDHTIIIFSGVVFLLMSFVILQTIRGLNIVIHDVTAEKGIIFSFIGALFVIMGGILAYRAEKRELLEKMYVANVRDAKNDLDEYEHIL